MKCINFFGKRVKIGDKKDDGYDTRCWKILVTRYWILDVGCQSETKIPISFRHPEALK
jgi:hypothetical protein